MPPSEKIQPEDQDFEVLVEQFSFRSQGMTREEIARSGYDVTVYHHNSNNGFTHSAMSRAQIAFMVARLQAFLEDTSQDNNMVYVMACGHELDTPYRLTKRSRGHCSQHGFQPLVGGDFLPSYRTWVNSLIKTARAAREALYSANY